MCELGVGAPIPFTESRRGPGGSRVTARGGEWSKLPCVVDREINGV